MILATGGAGYIGSHTIIQLLEAGHQVVVVDNLSNSSISATKHVEIISECNVHFITGDIRDVGFLRRVFKSFPITQVIHLAGVKAVGESVNDPLKYYDNNTAAAIALCRVMSEFSVFDLIFSSSATVYAPNETVLCETDALAPSNPYGHSKLMVEVILRSLAKSDSRWRIGALRYFNPIGAHPSGLIGESPNGEPNNLLPLAMQAAAGDRPLLSIFGTDYDTCDGTAERDYIHVVDLAAAHVKALDCITPGFNVWNIGTGQATSVMQIIDAVQRISQKQIPIKLCPRREGDTSRSVADPSKVKRDFGWSCQYNLDDAIAHAWQWHLTNANS